MQQNSDIEKLFRQHYRKMYLVARMLLGNEEVTLADMLKEMGEYYEKEVVYNRPNAKELRFYYEWDSNKSIDAIAEELNNSEQIHITVADGKLIVE